MFYAVRFSCASRSNFYLRQDEIHNNNFLFYTNEKLFGSTMVLQKEKFISISLSLYIYICVYIYMCIYIYILCFAVRLSFASMRSLISSVAFFTRHFYPLHACNYRSSTTGTHTLIHMMPSISVLCHMHESITNRLSSNIESVC